MFNKYQDYYRRIASAYDSVRLDGDEEIAYTAKIVGDFVQPHLGHLLDLGCGTARYSAAFEKLGFHVVGIDTSFHQLRHSNHSVMKVCGSVAYVPFGSNFSCCTAILILHQLALSERLSPFREIFRVLKPGGFFIIKTRSHSILKERPIVKYFPSALDININRYPDISEIESDLRTNGFKLDGTQETTTVSVMRTTDYLLRVRNKHNSTLALIPEDEFVAGYQKLEQALSNTDTVRLSIDHTFVIVHK